MNNYYVDISDSYVSTSSQKSFNFFGGLESKLDIPTYTTKGSYELNTPYVTVVKYGVDDLAPCDGRQQAILGSMTAQWSSSYFINNQK